MTDSDMAEGSKFAKSIGLSSNSEQSDDSDVNKSSNDAQSENSEDSTQSDNVQSDDATDSAQDNINDIFGAMTNNSDDTGDDTDDADRLAAMAEGAGGDPTIDGQDVGDSDAQDDSQSDMDNSEDVEQSSNSDEDLKKSSSVSQSSESINSTENSVNDSQSGESSNVSSQVDSNSINNHSSEATASHSASATDVDDAKGNNPKNIPFMNNSPIMTINDSRNSMKHFIKILSSMYEEGGQLTSDDFNELVNNLQDVFTKIYLAFYRLQLQNEANTQNLKNQLKGIHNNQVKLSKVNPKANLDLISEWVSKGIPEKIEYYYQKMSQIFADPTFQNFIKNHDVGKDLTPAQPFIHKVHAVSASNNAVQERKAGENGVSGEQR